MTPYFPLLVFGFYLPYSSSVGASMDDAASGNFPHSIVSDMFSGEKYSQHNGEIQSTLS